MTELPSALRSLLARQDGVASRRQLLEHGVTKAAIRWNSGRAWRVLLPTVYLLDRAAASERQRQVAALLWAGPHAVLGGATAARLHGITAADPGGRVQVDVPPPFASRRRGFAEVRRSLLIEHRSVRIGPLRACSAARAAVDAAFAAPTEDDREAILIEAIQKGLADLDDVAEWVFRLRPRDSARLHDALAAAASGAWSVPEAALLDLVGTSTTLPPPWANPGLTTVSGKSLVTPDAWFDDVALAVMVHSHRHHAQGEQWDATVEKDGDLVAAGVVVVGVTPRRITRDPAGVLARIEAAHVVARGRPRPPVIATRRHLRSA